MLELLYATGLRVSELVTLPVDQLRRDLATIIVTGKGVSRQAHVPSDSVVRAAVTAMLEAVGSPFAQPPNNAGRLEASSTAVIAWLSTLDVDSLLVDDAEHPALLEAGRVIAALPSSSIEGAA